MPNRLSDFPPDRFAITAYCSCGRSAQIDYRLLLPETLVNSLRPILVCTVCGKRDPGIRIHWAGAGGFKYSVGRMSATDRGCVKTLQCDSRRDTT